MKCRITLAPRAEATGTAIKVDALRLIGSREWLVFLKKNEVEAELEYYSKNCGP